MSLSAEQLVAVNFGEGVAVIVACPGSGKTAVITQRFTRLLSTGVPPSDILSLTFTAEAAAEMAKRAGAIDTKCFRTFHSFCLNLMKAERESVSFKMTHEIIPVENQNYELLFRLCKTYPQIRNFRDLQSQISLWKQTGVDPDRALDESNGNDYYVALAYGDYERISRDEGWLDFDSLQREAKLLLETNNAVRARWQYRYCQIDESQDMDVHQLKLVQLVSEKHKNVMFVGDSNQNIYEWRGAAVDTMSKVSQIFPGAQKLYLSINYRSTKRLVEFFREILPVDNGLASKMESAREEGVDPVIVRYSDDHEEADAVLNDIARKNDLVNTAVITRTNRQLYIFEKRCVSRGIKYRILGKKDFFELPEVVKLLKLAKEHAAEFDGMPAAEALNSIVHQYRLLHIYKPSDDPTEATPMENLTDICKMAKKHPDIPTFLAHLRKVTHARKSSKGLTLCTAHQSKGKEFVSVYVVGANQGNMPHSKGDLAEESRIWFVACSRASDNLTISYFKNLSMFVPKRLRPADRRDEQDEEEDFDGLFVHQ